MRISSSSFKRRAFNVKRSAPKQSKEGEYKNTIRRSRIYTAPLPTATLSEEEEEEEGQSPVVS